MLKYWVLSMLIVALDPQPNVDIIKWASHIFENLQDVVQGFKIGLPAVIKHGIEWISTYFKMYDGLLIADLKLADIGDIMSLTARLLKYVGFNAVIAHGFVGYKQGIEDLAKICEKENLKLILVVSMSHAGSQEFIDRHIDEFINIAKIVKTWGIIAPATRPDIVRYTRSRVGSSIKILSPGVGTQGADPGDALCAGADYEIVGRAITYAKDIRASALKILEQQKEKVLICRG